MPFKSSLVRSAGKLFGVFTQRDLDLRGVVQTSRLPPFEATGGAQKLTPGDGYTYHFFTSNDNLVATGSAGTVEYIIIGGGGAGCGQPGGNNHGGGGAGAGGVRTGSITVSAGTNPVVVGATKAAPLDAYAGALGNPSVAFGITVQGGGSGGGYDQASAEYNGGSGGGAPHYDAPGVGLGDRVTGTTDPAPDQGNDGGQGGHNASGGGGGAGGVGGNAEPPNTGGKGGLGIAFPGWTLPPSYGTPGPSGPLRYFAGGGGGGGNGSGGAAPDAGGGGAGANSADAGHGIVNTGGGGGSVAGDGERDGGDGGSGIVICRYTV